MLTADPASSVSGVTNCGIEECIALTPDGGNAGPVTVLHAGPKDDSGTNDEGFGTGPFIRNCFVDCGSPTATPEYRGLSMAWCKAGVVEGNQIQNTKYGGPYMNKSSSRDLVLRNNFYKNVFKGPYWNLGTLAPSYGTGSLSRSGTVATVTVTAGHKLVKGDRVKIVGNPADWRVTREIVTRLSKVPGLEVGCLGWSHDGWPYDRARFPFNIYPSRGAGDGSENFERAVQEFKPQVVITLGEIWMLEWLPAQPVRSQFKWIGYFPLDGGPFYPPWERMLKDVDELVAMSEFGRQVFQEGVPSRRIHVIPHGVDTNSFRPLPERERLKTHDRFRGKFVVGCVARNQPRKNIPALVKAFAALAGRIENLHLYLHMNPCDVGYDIVTLLHRHRLEGKADLTGPDFSLHAPLEDEQLNRSTIFST